MAGAAELAAKAVDILTLGAADADAKATRKRRLKAEGEMKALRRIAPKKRFRHDP